MPDQADNTTPAPTQPTQPTKPTRAKRSELDRATLKAIALADQCALAAAEPENAPLLRARDWTDAQQSALRGSIARCNDLTNSILQTRAKRKTNTKTENEARQQLLAALDPILIGAKRTYPEGSGERPLFGVGNELATSSTSILYRTARDAHHNLTPQPPAPAPAYKLKGVTTADITTLGNLVQEYKTASFAQEETLATAEELLDLLNTKVTDTLNPLRRDLQLTADQTWPYRLKTNRAPRQSFALPPDRPITE